ncbi:hypothetical protein CCYS_01660 [Corynebacterium cystitidis DSM 20524]|nr:hypothetical protein CCYS_01660 [Corynebacterium cystitidis DSM 20524]
MFQEQKYRAKGFDFAYNTKSALVINDELELNGLCM